MDEDGTSEDRVGEFKRLASRTGRGRSSAAAEFLYFLRRTRKWWMAPIIVTMFLIAGILVMSTTAVAPLIYALF